jgi:hypothetical protein
MRSNRYYGDVWIKYVRASFIIKWVPIGVQSKETRRCLWYDADSEGVRGVCQDIQQGRWVLWVGEVRLPQGRQGVPDGVRSPRSAVISRVFQLWWLKFWAPWQRAQNFRVTLWEILREDEAQSL